MRDEVEIEGLGSGIAVVGIAGSFPGAPDVRSFWHNLQSGVEGIRRFDDAELRTAGVPEALLDDPAYVKASGVVDGIDLFDAAFFGYSPHEARMMDPQQRRFLECAWEVLEAAGHPPERFAGAVGVFAGASNNTYLLNNLVPRFGTSSFHNAAEYILSMLGNAADFLPTRVSYKLDLRGPSLNVQTACSTSLTAVVLACQALVSYQCDMALAGGVSLRVPHTAGYLYQQGGILSPDGRCRAFDAQARGCVPGNGWGIVALRRLEDAVADGDHIHAVLRGWALTNDGANKVGFTAPSVEGQAEVIAAAHAVSGLGPEDIDYVEAHGTGTKLGDPIEVEALTQVFGAATDRRGFCGLGSVKSSIGHLDAAAGVAGLIKTVLALEHCLLPPTLHVDEPSPRIGFDQTPFYVNTTPRPWMRRTGPRRAGVSAFGIGGTNAHVVLEEAPDQVPLAPVLHPQLLLLSARNLEALDDARGRLQAHLAAEPDAHLASVAHTLQVGRRAFEYRCALVCDDLQDAIAALAQDAQDRRSYGQARPERSLVFLFPGGGAQYVAMGRELYSTEPVFRTAIDHCVGLLADGPGSELMGLYGYAEASSEALRRPSLALPMLFETEVALAKLLGSWGITPVAMMGHSLGEYAAACLSGVLSLEDALALVALRGRLFERLAPGAMLGVGLPEAQARELLGAELSIAAINGPAMCTLSGPIDAIDAVERQLQAREVGCRRLHIDAAGHSAMLEPILAEFEAFVRTLRLAPPSTPYISNVTGTWASADQVMDPRYWVRHLREPVRFSDGLAELSRRGPCIFLEVGPGQALSRLARSSAKGEHLVLATMRHADEQGSDVRRLLEAVGRLWTAGVSVDWDALHGEASRRRVPLPTYPFQRQRYWIDAPEALAYSGALTRAEDHAEPAEPSSPSEVRTHLVAPRTETERRVAEVWRALLGLDAVGIHDNFFELGGHSLLALQVIARLKDLPGAAHLTPGALLDAPTVAEFAALLAPQSRSVASGRAPGGWVRLRPGQPQATPLFLSHAAGGHLLFYEPLADKLGARRPIYGFEAVGLAGDEPPLCGLEAIARRQVEALLKLQPRGPYLLGGSSLGGAIGFEMAHQLRARGHRVGGVFMLDTPAPWQDSPEQRLADLAARPAEELLPNVPSNRARPMKEVVVANIRALHDYRPRPLEDVPVFFFRARERRSGDSARDELPWFQWAAGGMEVHLVPGDHESMLQPPHVEVLVARMQSCLARVDAASESDEQPSPRIREWSIGPRHQFRSEAPNVLWLKTCGETTLQDAYGTIATYRELGTERPLIFLADVSEATSISPAARLYAARQLRGSWFQDVAYIGARPGLKAFLGLRFFPLALLRGSKARIHFFDTEAEARVWLTQLQNNDA